MSSPTLSNAGGFQLCGPYKVRVAHMTRRQYVRCFCCMYDSAQRMLQIICLERPIHSCGTRQLLTCTSTPAHVTCESRRVLDTCVSCGSAVGPGARRLRHGSCIRRRCCLSEASLHADSWREWRGGWREGRGRVSEANAV